ncbi:hypothetical protein [Tsukamurella tyrosinosolvens]|uniref:hypothetical protein n=1 Tax=Tsukamurella tyrosinosolvens TaxID=57704 RepID=UPI0015F14990|nr:hypothetical protein [Tsukamurella tyrosinosolvens]MEC4611775.1 hypothetical protein [Tsukamurella tyrosinosolvens]
MASARIKNLLWLRLAADVITFAFCAVLGWEVGLIFPKVFVRAWELRARWRSS